MPSARQIGKEAQPLDWCQTAESHGVANQTAPAPVCHHDVTSKHRAHVRCSTRLPLLCIPKPWEDPHTYGTSLLLWHYTNTPGPHRLHLLYLPPQVKGSSLFTMSCQMKPGKASPPPWTPIDKGGSPPSHYCPTTAPQRAREPRSSSSHAAATPRTAQLPLACCCRLSKPQGAVRARGPGARGQATHTHTVRPTSPGP